ncbi:MAG: type IV secretory system conjugative DNA transfer family protein, partial [Nitratireductor sp.]
MSLFVLFGTWGATQYVAYKYGYHPALGEPLFSVGAHKFYAPPMWFVWIFQFAEPVEPIFDTAYLIMTASTTAGFFIFITAVTMKKKLPSGKFGTAKWATSRELEPLKGHSGVIIGWSGDKRDRRGNIPRYVCHGGPEHVALIAPSRSGKGASTIVPTLFRWTESAFVLDVKGENWIATSGWRSRFSTCFRFDPASPDSAKFNPLQEIRLDHHAVSDADLIASMLVDPDGTKLNPSYWDQAARIFLKVVILHIRYVDPEASLARVKVWLNRPGIPMEAKLAEMAATRHLGEHVHPVIAEGVQTLNDKYFPEFSSILSTARSYLAIYDDTMLADNTSSSDFTIDMLMNGDRPVSVYVVFTPSNVQRLRFFLRLFVSLVVRKLTDVNVEAGSTPHRRRCLFLLDEFPRLGNLSLLHDAIGYLAGYGIKCLIVAQSVNDLYRIYGRDQTIIENCAVRIFHATNDPDTGEYVSRLAGTATHREHEINVSGHRL